MTREQQNLLNAACTDLSEQIDWHGRRLTKDQWRHLLTATVLGWIEVPGIDLEGHGAPPVLLGESSLKLSDRQAGVAIDLAFWVGDDPAAQKLQCDPVRWGPAVCKARWLIKE